MDDKASEQSNTESNAIRYVKAIWVISNTVWYVLVLYIKAISIVTMAIDRWVYEL